MQTNAMTTFIKVSSFIASVRMRDRALCGRKKARQRQIFSLSRVTGTKVVTKVPETAATTECRRVSRKVITRTSSLLPTLRWLSSDSARRTAGRYYSSYKLERDSVYLAHTLCIIPFFNFRVWMRLLRIA